MSELIEVKTIAEVERIVNGSLLWDGTGPVEFSNDGTAWSEAWAPTDEHPHPQFARVSVYRKEVRIPTTVTIRWDEQFPAASEEWAGKWLRSPMRHFGRTVRMVGYRQTFRELLGNTVIEDEDHTDRPEATPADAAPAVERDWAAEIAAAMTSAEIDDIERDARAARVFTPNAAGTALHRALKDRRRELAAVDPWSAPIVVTATSPDPGGIADLTPAEADAFMDAITGQRARREPKDYLPPANRAERRKAARRKGGKR